MFQQVLRRQLSPSAVRTGAAHRGGTHPAGNRAAVPLPVTMATTQQTGLGQKCQFKQLLISSNCPCIPHPLVRYECVAGHSFYQTRKLVLILMENHRVFSLFWLILFHTASFVTQLSCSHTNTLCLCNEAGGRSAGTSGLRAEDSWLFKQHYHQALAKTNLELSSRLWFDSDRFNTPGSSPPCPSGPHPHLLCCPVASSYTAAHGIWHGNPSVWRMIQ